MQEPSSNKTSDAKTRIVPIDHRRSVIKLTLLRNGCIRLTYHTVGRRIWLSDLTDQEALALQAAINDTLIEFDNEETHK